MKKTLVLMTIISFCLGVGWGENSAVSAEESLSKVEQYQEAANGGEPEAMNNLAVSYLLGEGVPKDERKSFYWFRQAADRGHVDAMFGLGWGYDQGRGVAQNAREAVRWYRQAASTTKDPKERAKINKIVSSLSSSNDNEPLPDPHVYRSECNTSASILFPASAPPGC